MKRLRDRLGLPGKALLLVALSLPAIGAAPGPQPYPGPAPQLPSEVVTPVQTKPPTCRPELQADTSCRSGLRTDEVCYQGSRVVSTTIGQCVPLASVTSPKPTKPPKPPKAVK